MPRDKIGIIDVNTFAYIASNKIITYNFEENSQSFINNKGFSISTFAADFHRGILVWGTIEEEPKLIFYKLSNTNNPIINTIQLESNYEQRHIEFSHMGDVLAVCSGYNLDSKVILHVLETETFLTNSYMRHEMHTIPNKVQFNPNNSRMIFLLFDQTIEILHQESLFEKFSTTFDQDKLIKLKQTKDFDQKINMIQIDSNGQIYIDQGTKIQVLTVNQKNRCLDLKMEYDCESKITYITATRDFLITCHTDSTLILRNSQQEDAGKDYKPFDSIYRVRLTGYNIVNAIFEPTYRYLFAVTDNGKILKFNIAESDAGGDDEDEVDEGPQVKDIPENKEEIHSFIYSNQHSALNISVDGTSSYCSVVSTSGQLVVLDLNKQTEKFNTCEAGVEQTAVLAQKGLAVVGDSRGYLRVFDQQSGQMIDFIKMFDGQSIDFIVKDHQEQNNVIAVFSKQTNKFWVCCFRQDLPTNKLLIVGHDYIPQADVNKESIGTIDEVGFVEYTPEQRFLMVSTTKLVVMCIDIYKKIDQEEDPRENIRLNPMQFGKTQGKLFPEAIKMRINQETKKAHIQGQEERSRVWQKIWRLDSFPTAAELSQADLKQTDLKYNAKDISDVEVLLFNQLKDTNVQQLQDGSLKIWANGRDKEMPQEVDMVNGGVKQLQITQNVFLLLTTDNSLCSYKYNMGETTFEPELFVKNPDHSSVVVIDENLYQTQLIDELQQKDYLAENSGKILEQNKQLINSLTDIKERLTQMLEENSNNPELRKLNREEFLINIKFNDILEQDMKKQIAIIRERSKINNLKSKAERYLILKQTKDKMENDYNGISGIKQDITIYNQVIPKTDAKLEMEIGKAKYRAMIDLRAKVWRRSNKKKVIDFNDFKYTGQENYIVNIVPGENKVVENLMKLKGPKEEAKNEIEPSFKRIKFEIGYWNDINQFRISELKPYQFLYEPFEVNTRNKKINMISLIYDQITWLKREFNKRYKRINTDKMAARENIGEQLKNIRDICQELDLPQSEDPIPTHEQEDTKQIFNTKESEVKVERIYTDEEIQKQEEERRIKEEEERKKNEDDWLKRGSTDMMNDTLDNRKGLKGKKKGLEKDEWMDGDPNDFTDEQKKLYQEYLEKIKAKEEEERRIREELNDNLKKAKMAVTKFETDFDRELTDVFAVKSQLDKLITAYELYSIKLLMSIYSDENVPAKIELLNSKIDRLSKTQEEYPADREFAISSESRDNDPKRNKDRKDPSNLQLTELAKNFQNETKEKQQKNPNAFQLDLSYLKALQNQELMEQCNCYQDKEAAYFKEYIVRRVSNPPLGFKKKGREEGRILLENVKKELAESIESSKRDVEFLINIKNDKGDYTEEKDNSEFANIKLMLKPDIIVQVTANKIEIGSYDDPVNYKNAKFIFKKKIIDFNHEIDEQGKKISENLVNRKKNEFKRRRQDLERDVHHYSGEVYKALTEALQMLKVTKELQNKLNYIDVKSDNNLDVNQMIERKKRENLEARIQKYDRQMSKKFNSQGEELDRLTREIERYQREKVRLESEMVTIDSKMNKFVKIKLNETQDSKDSTKRMKDVAKKRRMLDQMKAYQEEIDFLKEELDKLRAKTFPSFANTKPVV